MDQTPRQRSPSAVHLAHAARPSARRQTSSARPAGPRARVDGKNTRAASAAKRHHVGSAPLVGLWRPEHLRRRRHGELRWRARSAGRCRLWRCVLLRSLCGAGRQGGCSRLRSDSLAPSTRARTRPHERVTSWCRSRCRGRGTARSAAVQHESSRPVAHRMHFLRKAAAAASVTAEGHAVELLLTPEQLLRKRDRCFRLSAGCPARLPNGTRADLLRAALRDTARAPPAAHDNTTKVSQEQARGSPNPALCAQY